MKWPQLTSRWWRELCDIGPFGQAQRVKSSTYNLRQRYEDILPQGDDTKQDVERKHNRAHLNKQQWSNIKSIFFQCLLFKCSWDNISIEKKTNGKCQVTL